MSADDDARHRYYDRVAPVVGETLRERTVAARGGASLSRALGALGRTGVTRFLFAADADLEAAALQEDLASHNRWESYRVQQGAVADSHLLVAYAGAGTTGAVSLAEAQRARVPAVIGWLLEQGPSRRARLVWLPEMAQQAGVAEALLARAAELDAFEQAPPSRRFFDWLDLNGLMLSAAQNLLLRGSRRQADELESMWLAESRALLLHGSVRWPWETAYPDIGHRLPPSGVGVEPVLPAALTARRRVLVIGCGTASLMLAEATRFFRTLVMCDAKPFSVFNPVRQLAGTDHVDGELKPYVLQALLASRVDAFADGSITWEESRDGPVRWRRGGGFEFGAAELLLKERDPESLRRFQQILDVARPDVVVVAMGRSRDDNFTACRILRERAIAHVVPTAFPGVTHYKHIVVDGASGPCYACLQNRLPVDTGPAPELAPEARELFYGGTQPATLAETFPSAFSLLRLVVAVALPDAARPAWFRKQLSQERPCFVGANRALRRDGEWLYGVSLPHQMVTYGVEDVQVGVDSHCPACGRPLGKQPVKAS